MLYECGICGYNTDRKSNFQHHNARKYRCTPKHIVPHVTINPIGNGETELNGKVFGLKGKCIDVEELNPHECLKCRKILSSPRSLQRHQISCNGCHSLQCSNCFKEFKSPQSKYYHINNIKCEKYLPPESIQQENERLKEQVEQNKIQFEIKDVTIDKLQNQIEIKDTEIQNLIELAFEEGKLLKKPDQKSKPKRTFVTPMIRIEIAASQSWCCRICVKILPAYFHIDHTVPLWNDGDDVLENLTALCISCHGEKTHNERKQRSFL